MYAIVFGMMCQDICNPLSDDLTNVREMHVCKRNAMGTARGNS